MSWRRKAVEKGVKRWDGKKRKKRRKRRGVVPKRCGKLGGHQGVEVSDFSGLELMVGRAGGIGVI